MKGAPWARCPNCNSQKLRYIYQVDVAAVSDGTEVTHVQILYNTIRREEIAAVWCDECEHSFQAGDGDIKDAEWPAW